MTTIEPARQRVSSVAGAPPFRGRRLAGPAVSRPRHPLTGKHVVVVGINYAPEPTGIAPYTRGMAEYLAAHASSVTVLTGMPHYPNWRVAPEYRFRFRTRESVEYEPVSGMPVGLMVRRLRHYVPARQSALTRAAYEMTFMANAWSAGLNPRPDLVIAVTPSLGGAVAGARLAERHGARLLVVVQDLMARAASESGIAGGGRAAAATASLERYALRRADRVAVVSGSFRSAVEQYGVPDDRISLLRNWTHISPSPMSPAEARSILGWPVDEFTVVHTGNIGLKQDLGNLVSAAQLCLDEPGIRFAVVGEGSQRSHVESRATGLPNIAFVDPLDAVRYPLALAAADVLLLNERSSVGDMSLPSKLTSYLCAGRPVLAAVNPNGASAKELQRTGGAGLIVQAGDPLRLAAAVKELRDDAHRRATMSRAGQAYSIAHLGRDAAMRRLEAVVAHTLDGTI